MYTKKEDESLGRQRGCKDLEGKERRERGASFDPSLLPTGALEDREQDEPSDSRHRMWSVCLSQSGAWQGH